MNIGHILKSIVLEDRLMESIQSKSDQKCKSEMYIGRTVEDLKFEMLYTHGFCASMHACQMIWKM